ncbi:hypothetical protein [Chitinophaga caseinilytica]|uniref:hypothetical protein n=1 Tax=Chitinophaga caseinilytica TaxID=2267521 RepID=UPI003C2B7EAC
MNVLWEVWGKRLKNFRIPKNAIINKTTTMIPEANLKISLEERSLRGKRIIAKQPEISYAEALEQVKRLKEFFKVAQSNKKSRPEPGGAFVYMI